MSETVLTGQMGVTVGGGGSVSGSANVVPSARVIPAVSVAANVAQQWAQVKDPFSPWALRLDRVTGGFNSVVEVASSYCLRVFSNYVDPPAHAVAVEADVLDDFLAANQLLLQAAGLAELELERDARYAVAIAFVPRELSFEAPHRACVTYVGRVQLARVVPQFELDRGEWVEALPPPLDPHEWRRSLAAPPVAETKAPIMRRRAKEPWLPPELVDLLEPEAELELAEFADLGPAALRICFDYRYREDAPLKHVEVYADLGQPSLTLDVPAGDAKLFYDEFLAAEQDRLLPRAGGQVPLAPAVSLVGRNPGVVVTELPDFEARVFHVGTAPRQALVIAVDAMPGCQGTIEDVENFIGPQDYGVISDEWIVERVFKHKWRIGGFARQIPLEETIQVDRDGQTEDATLQGTMTLNTLDAVAIETDSNTRTDFVRVGGGATTLAERVILRDGSVVGRDDVDLGPAHGNPWSVFTGPRLQAPQASDPRMRTFQARAHTDAYRHLARPFARFPLDRSLTVVFARTDGITKHVFYLGDFARVFV